MPIEPVDRSEGRVGGASGWADGCLNNPPASELPAAQVVLINWKRPDNMLAVLGAMRAQSVPLRIVLCECSPEPQYAPSKACLDLCDEVVRWDVNIGPSTRFLSTPKAAEPYTLFAVDDFVPGRRWAEGMLREAEYLTKWTGGKWLTIGQDGRRIELRADGDHQFRRVAKVRVHSFDAHFMVSSEIMPTARLAMLAQCRAELQSQFGNDISHFEDDLLVAYTAMRNELKCMVVPVQGDEWSWRIKSLDWIHALSSRDDHQTKRQNYVERVLKPFLQPQQQPLPAAG